MSEEIKFEVNDKVKAFGCEGVVELIYNNTVGVRFSEISYPCYFNTDGKLNTWHKEPSLVLVEKAKKEVLLHEYLIKIKDTYYIEFHETDEKFKNVWTTKPIIKTGRTVTIKE